jgi:hypothetical protein
VLAPASVFTVHGGVELFGLTLLGASGLCLPASVLPTLAARVSRTDVDTIDARAAEIDSQIGGVHYSQGLPARGPVLAQLQLELGDISRSDIDIHASAA